MNKPFTELSQDICKKCINENRETYLDKNSDAEACYVLENGFGCNKSWNDFDNYRWDLKGMVDCPLNGNAPVFTTVPPKHCYYFLEQVLDIEEQITLNNKGLGWISKSRMKKRDLDQS